MSDKFEYAMGLIKSAWRYNTEDDLEMALKVMLFGGISVGEMLEYLADSPPKFDESRLPKHEVGDSLTLHLPKPYVGTSHDE